MDWTIYGFVCLCFGGIVGFLFGLAARVPEDAPATNGAAYEAMEPTAEPEPQYIRDARAAANGAPWWEGETT